MHVEHNKWSEECTKGKTRVVDVTLKEECKLKEDPLKDENVLFDNFIIIMSQSKLAYFSTRVDVIKINSSVTEIIRSSFQNSF